MALFFASPKDFDPVSLRREAETLLDSLDLGGNVQAKFSPAGENRLRRAGREGDFRQFRDYATQDRPQDIDWKRSARSDGALVREREKKQRRPHHLFVETSSGMAFRSAPGLHRKRDIACLLSMTLGLYAARLHDPLRLSGDAVKIDDLAHGLLSRKGADGVFANRNDVAVLCGDFLGDIESTEAALGGVQAAKTLVFQILDPAEIDLPYTGRARFENHDAAALIGDVDTVRSLYREKLTAHTEKLSRFARRKDWHYERVRSDGDMRECLARAVRYIGDAS